MAKPIDEMAVVITGASSGIGKATALAFAEAGAKLVIAARRQPQLEQTAVECRAAGAQVAALVTDVTEETEVKALAGRALTDFGRIDVWINNAGIDAFGSFEQLPKHAFERIIQVNLLGTVNGTRAVLPHFRERGSGTVINNASMVGAVPSPFHTAYVASKFAIRGFSHSLRQELTEFPGIQVCVISPASIDTPLWQRAANYSGRKVKPFDPVHPPEQVAAVMLDLARNPQREAFAGASGWMLAEQHAANPDLTETMVAGYARASLFQDEPAAPTDGVLFKPEDGNSGASGGWMSLNTPGIPTGDLLPLLMAPGLLAAAPALYAWKLSSNFVQQISRQFTIPPKQGR
ncbi:SDR family oxidoreductase [Methylobacterium segetis]|uniref:SDR family oxidoreductase n=1 Tax=Methylobacterium segetis TaxID=2488750 RepID=UPI001A9FFA5F|nr:SDR family oxidoreductase [Methylobacterium segetis]